MSCEACHPRLGSRLWSARAIVGSFSSRRCKEHSGNSEQSAMPNGPVCPCERCWSVPTWQKMLARSCSKERIVEHPKKSPFLPNRSRMLGACPRAKAICPDVLIAHQMNGRDLPRDHGFPARAIVPGHYGMASVKWLTHIQAVREPFHGYWLTSDYAYWASMDGKPVRRPLGEMQLKSEIARPRVYETLAPNQTYTVSGAAWTGETDVTEIAVSTDGGRTWAQAEFLDPMRRHAWRRWKFDWLTPKEPGQYTLLARAKDADGLIQPDKHDQNYGTYVINHPLPIEVFVDDSVDR